MDYEFPCRRLECLRMALYALVSLIPEGRVASYKTLAQALGVSPRLVARLLATNPNPIAVPCHRVVYSDGRLGGYTPRGPRFKAKLLSFEGVEVSEGKVPKDRFIGLEELLRT